jgi:hypothetical protein
LCVDGRPDDRVLIKKMRQGSNPGLYRLRSAIRKSKAFH